MRLGHDAARHAADEQVFKNAFTMLANDDQITRPKRRLVDDLQGWLAMDRERADLLSGKAGGGAKILQGRHDLLPRAAAILPERSFLDTDVFQFAFKGRFVGMHQCDFCLGHQRMRQH